MTLRVDPAVLTCVEHVLTSTGRPRFAMTVYALRFPVKVSARPNGAFFYRLIRNRIRLRLLSEVMVPLRPVSKLLGFTDGLRSMMVMPLRLLKITEFARWMFVVRLLRSVRITFITFILYVRTGSTVGYGYDRLKPS